jgi:hypothetical protein
MGRPPRKPLTTKDWVVGLAVIFGTFAGSAAAVGVWVRLVVWAAGF